jgi:thiol:disulfide interchange protein
LLNLMPCVFPVLALKVLGFARHAEDQRSHRLSGLAYTAGVLLSFVALGLLLIGLRAAGQGLGWGFQLQDPVVVTALALLFTLIALNLAGVFEFGQWLPSSVASLQARHPVIDAFLTGVLAVAVASPCTAPFMGASLGLTLMLPAWQALAVYLAVGVGLAAPYLLASWVPAVARALPQPGAWMLTLRRLLAFPMWLTVVWLVWVLGQQVGMNGAAALLVLLVLFSGVVWASTLAGRARVALVVAFALLGGLALWITQPLTSSDGTEAGSASRSTAPTSRWQDWSPERQAELLSQGRNVFVDYTAAWCVTCQVNERSTLRDAEVLADFDARQVVMLRADWTRRDPRIGRALAELGRNGVPVYVLLGPGQPPRVLPEVLSPATLRAALAEL